MARPLRRPRQPQVPDGQHRPVPQADASGLCGHLLPPPARPGHPHRGDDGRAGSDRPQRQGAVCGHLELSPRRDQSGGGGAAGDGHPDAHPPDPLLDVRAHSRGGAAGRGGGMRHGGHRLFADGGRHPRRAVPERHSGRLPRRARPPLPQGQRPHPGKARQGAKAFGHRGPPRPEPRPAGPAVGAACAGGYQRAGGGQPPRAAEGQCPRPRRPRPHGRGARRDRHHPGRGLKDPAPIQRPGPGPAAHKPKKERPFRNFRSEGTFSFAFLGGRMPGQKSVLLALQLLHPQVVAQDPLADPQRLRGHLEQLVRGQKLKARLKAQMAHRHQPQRVVTARGAGVGQVLGLADIHRDVLAGGGVAHHHALVHLFARLDQEGTAALRVKQAVGHRLARLVAHKAAAAAAGHNILLCFCLLIVISSCFLLGEVIYLNVVKRKRMFAIFKAMGATSFQISMLVLSQGLFMSLWAYLQAFIFLKQIVQFINEMIGKLIQGVSHDFFVIDYQILWYVLFFTFIFTVMSCLIPIMKANKIDIIEGIKG